MCFRIVETTESPQEVETTDGNHENYHFQANLSQNPGWTPRGNHGRVETTDGNHKNYHFQVHLSQNPGWTPRGNHGRVETTEGWTPQQGGYHRVTTGGGNHGW